MSEKPLKQPEGATGRVALAEGVGGARDPNAPPARGRMPDFFIVGHEKCGTTALYRMLMSHPQIFMPDLKEPRFFSWDLRLSPRRAGGARPDTLERYLALFADATPEQRVGEASPQYIRSPGAAARIAALAPDARIVAILREPASFLRSFHLQCVLSKLETERDLRKALALEDARREGRNVPPGTHPSWLMYSEHVRYVEQLERFRAVFGPANVLTLIYEEYRADSEAAVREVLRLLEVDDTHAILRVETSREQLKAVRVGALHRLAGQVRMARIRPQVAGPLARVASALTPQRLQQLGRRVVYTEPPPADAQLMLELRQRFKPEVVALGEYLGRDLLDTWGYADVD